MANPRVLVLGLDGLAPSFLERWIEAGELPFLRDLRADGASGILRSTIPPYTPTAWTSIVTGVNPGRHGIFGFTRWTADGRQVLTDSNACKAKTIWDLLTEQDRPSLVMNVPVTYPPRPLSGVLVAGMGTPPNTLRFAYPDSVHEEIDRIAPGYVADVAVSESATMSNREAAGVVQAIDQALELRLAAAQSFFTQKDWEFGMVVFEAPDRVQHLFWKCLDPDAPPTAGRDRAMAVYRRLDAGLERLVEAIAKQGPVTILVVSDHGFQDLNHILFMNNYLAEAGLLRTSRSPNLAGVARRLPPGIRHLGGRVLSRAAPKLLQSSSETAIDWDVTAAFSGQVFEHGVYVRGTDDPQRHRETLERVIRVLEQLEGPDGGQAISSVIERDSIYTGPWKDDAPHLFPHFRLPGVMMSGSLSNPSVWGSRVGVPRGTHHEDGVVIMAGGGVTRGSNLFAHAQDVAPTVLALLGGPLPGDLDGAVIAAAGISPVPACGVSSERPTAEPSEYTLQEEEEIVERLRGLGYLD